jgi:hypothetical protein
MKSFTEYYNTKNKRDKKDGARYTHGGIQKFVAKRRVGAPMRGPYVKR